MSKTIPNLVAVRAYTADPRSQIEGNRRSGTPAASENALPGKGGVFDRASGPAFVVELSTNAHRALGEQADLSRKTDAASETAVKDGGRQSQEFSQPIFDTVNRLAFTNAQNLQQADFEVEIGPDGRGRREAPLSSGNGPVILKPAGSVVDIHV